MEALTERLSRRLREPLPGEAAQYQMAPAYRTRGSFPGQQSEGYRNSAVLALLCRRSEGGWFIPLTLRREYAGLHSAQVSLPGGKYEEADGDLAVTALRECYEEIGLHEHVELLGKLSPLHIPASKFIVQPFVAAYEPTEFEYRSHEREVQAVLELPLSEMLESSAIHTGCVAGTGRESIEAPYFAANGYKIWGATAMILFELRCLIQEVIR